MQVLAFSDYGWPEHGGGVERTLTELYPRISRRYGVAFSVITLAPRHLPRVAHHDQVTFLRARRLPLEQLAGAQVAASLDVWPMADTAVKQLRPALIHVHTLFFYTSIVGAALAWRYQLPLLVTAHLGSVAALPAPYRYAAMLHERSVGRLVLARARRVICVSADVQRHMRTLGVPDERTLVIPNGVDPQRFTPRAVSGGGVPVIVCVGRLIFNKGQHVLLAAVAALLHEGWLLHLVLVGEGPQEQVLRRRAQALGVADVTTFAGQRDDVEHLLQQADIFVRPSLSEGMSLAVLEAMAAGLPVIATDVSGSRELIDHGESGLIVAPGSVPALAAALGRLVADGELRHRFGARARARHAGAFSWDSIAAATLEEMLHAVER